MKISLAWLRTLVDAPFDADDLVRRLTLAGFEVEARAPFAAMSGVVVARVVKTRPHPDAAKLTLVTVDDGSGAGDEVVCGAPNVPGPGARVVWARPGARLPNGVEIAAKPVRGIVSPGMLCAEDELGIGGSHAGPAPKDGAAGPVRGIIVLGDNDELAGLRDEIWELNVTPNRPDCLGHVGVAREAAALLGARLLVPAAPALPGAGAPAKVDLVDVEGCPRYTGLVVEGVRVAPSPLATRARLFSLGVRPISNVVDATNLAWLLTGQPVHAFDLDRLQGGGVIIRRARAGETIVTLDDQTRALVSDDVVICDAAGPVAVAGVMGGAASEVSAQTTRLFLESAHFQPGRVRRTAKRLGLHTEASHRYERGTDPNACAEVMRHLAGDIVRLAGGRVASALADVYPSPARPLALALRPARTELVVGVRLPAEEQSRLLASIGLGVDTASEGVRVTVPTFRPDLTREIDLVEEVARLYGFDRVQARLPKLEHPPAEMRALDEVRLDAARDALCGLGLDEIVCYGFVGKASVLAFGADAARLVTVANPLREDEGVMRTTLLPGLLQALGRNLARFTSDVRIFEVGAVFARGAAGSAPRRPGPVEERWHVAGLLHGRADGWLKPGAPFDFYDVKGVVEALLAGLGYSGECAPSTHPWLHPGTQADVLVGGARVGVVGELHPRTGKTLALAATPLVFEVDLDALPARAAPAAGELPRFPSVTRDLSFFVDEQVTAASIRALFEANKSPLLVEVRVLEDYRGDKRPQGKKGMLWSFVYRAPDRTLTDAEVEALHAEVVQKLAAALPVERR